MTPVEQACKREQRLVKGLNQLAVKHGIAFRQPLQIDANGEFSLVVSNGTAHDGSSDACGQYGEELATFLSQFRPRTGIAPTAYLIAQNGWCMMNHFDVERMLEAAKLPHQTA